MVPTTRTAGKSVTVVCMAASINIGSLKHVLLHSIGACNWLEGGNIELHAPAMVAFKASLKEFTGPKMASYSLPQMPKAGELPHWIVLNYVDAETANGIPQQPFEIHFKDGAVVRGELDAQGKARREDIPDNPVKKVMYLPRQADKDVVAPSLSRLIK